MVKVVILSYKNQKKMIFLFYLFSFALTQLGQMDFLLNTTSVRVISRRVNPRTFMSG